MEQQLPTKGQQDVTGTLIELLKQRQAKGIETYGRSLETFNGRNSVQGALEEQIDNLQYTLQWALERAAMIEMMERLVEALRIFDGPWALVDEAETMMAALKGS